MNSVLIITRSLKIGYAESLCLVGYMNSATQFTIRLQIGVES